MNHHPNRRRILQTGAALAGVTALGAPALLHAQADKIKIGHLTPLTGFLGALGEYAVMGIKMATEEINAAGGVMGRQLDVMSEDSVNPQVASSKAQRMIERDGVAVLMGEINSASALTISQVAARNKKLFLSIGARSDALRGKDCNRYTFHVDIPVTVMVNAAGQALVREGLVKGKKIYSLTADYLFGHDLSRAGQEVLRRQRRRADRRRTGGHRRHRLQPLPAEDPPGQARPGRHQPGRQPGHQLRQAVRRVRPALSGGRLQPEHGRRLGGRRGQPGRHLADGVAPRPARRRVRWPSSPRSMKKYGKPPENHAWIEYVSLKIMAQAMNETKSTDTEKLIAYFE